MPKVYMQIIKIKIIFIQFKKFVIMTYSVFFH